MTRPFRLGLTGSIGMGKSATSDLFAKAGIPVWDADTAVHRLYRPGARGTQAIAQHWPDAVGPDGVDRARLRKIIQGDDTALMQIESLIHPLVAADRAAFAQSTDSDIAVFDIPLLFETGADTEMDATLLVTAPPAVQRVRVLARPGMTPQMFQTILGRQMPDRDKRARATHIIETLSPEAACAGVTALIDHIRQGPTNA
jgi:dephospho-CoA kinase